MKTALIQEEPVVAIFCQSRKLQSAVVNTLSSASFSSWIFDVEKPSFPTTEIYKSIVLFTGLETTREVASILNTASQVNKNTIVCLPYLPKIQNAPTELQTIWDQWFEKLTNLQTQAISSLTSAQFLLIDGWVDELEKPTLSSINLLFSPISQGSYWQCRSRQFIITTDQIIKIALEYLGRPGVMPSVLVRGEDIDFFAVSNQVVGIYEVTHRTTIQPVFSEPRFEQALPFEVQIQKISSNQQNLPSNIAKQLDSYGKPNRFLTPLPVKVGVVEIRQTQQKASPPVIIDTKHESSENTQPAPPTSRELKPVEFGDQLERIFSQSRIKEKEHHLTKLQTTEKKAKKKLKHNKVLFIIGSISSGISLAILLMGALFILSVRLASNQLFAVVPTEFLSFTEAGNSQQSLQKTIGLLKPQLRLVGQFVDHPLVNEAQSTIDAYERIRMLQTTEEERKKLQTTIAEHILGQQPTSIAGVLQDFLRLTQTSYTNLAQLQSLLSTSSESEEDNKDWYSNLKEVVSQRKTSAGYIQSLSPLLPTILGIEDKTRTYAILFLNSSELRPTGGFVQAVALVTVEDGQITATQTLSSYEIDRRIGGVIEPPQDIQDILKEKSWYFRDSNWDPHHPESAKRASWFIEKAMGVRVDGVISLPTTAFAELLEVTGPLTLPQYNESLTSKNIQERLNFHAEVELTDQLKNYPSAVLDAFFQHILQKSSEEFSAVLAALPTLLTSGEIQFSLISKEEQELLQPLRWSGSLVIPVCPSQFSQVPCVVDSVYQVETNVGVNRVNASIKRSVEDKIEFSPNLIKHQRFTKLTNSATSTAWPSGQYSTYVRWYLPLKSQLDEILINGVVVDQATIRRTQEHGLLVLGLVVEIPIQSTKTIQINYHQPIAQPLPFSYFFFDQKQPGSTLDSYRVVIQQPTGSSVVRLAPNALIENSTLTFEPELGGHLLTAVQFK
ncbi:MAG TPA: DUF4012 domain-containing protein [Candidatus Woesebacteria bacterium]|nr:DUF4012 domain-containing protein [Candidatus Woesebacteria bacterium]